MVVGAISLAILSWLGSSRLLTGNWPWDVDWQPDRLELTKFSLTLLAGAGAIIALVVAYRKQKDLEDGRFVERFGAAAAKLGATTAAERLAGAYAMAGAADRHPKQAQQCIEVLCGYLRLPYSTGQGDEGNLVTKKVVEINNTLSSGSGGIIKTETIEKSYAYLTNDQEVRRSIVRLIADHVRTNVYPGWHELSFDLRGATLPIAPFREAVFRGILNLEGATLLDDIDFTGARFEARTSLKATYRATTLFNRAVFADQATFSGAIFEQAARFEKARSSKAIYFCDTQFHGSVGLGGAKFVGTTNFHGAAFSDPPTCGDSTVQGVIKTPAGVDHTEGTAKPLGPFVET